MVKRQTLSKTFYVLLLLCACATQRKHQTRFFAMDTFVEITIMTPHGIEAGPLFDVTREEVLRCDSLFSVSNEQGELYAVNNRRDSVVTLAPEVAALLRVSAKEWQLSGGIFDPTILPLKELWGFRADTHAQVPDTAQIARARALVDMGAIRFVDDTTLILRDSVQLDLGGIAKGYIIGRMAARLQEAGVTNYLVNAGGDIVASGRKTGGALWRIAVQHPREETRFLATLTITDCAVVTSGDYERFFERDGVRYHHLLDPHTGYPGRYNVSSTVIAADAAQADAAATAAFLMPASRAVAWLHGRGMRGIVVDTAMTAWASESLHEIAVFDSAISVRWVGGGE